MKMLVNICIRGLDIIGMNISRKSWSADPQEEAGMQSVSSVEQSAC